ncbi:hypothetical protein GY45DRAFT_1320660 [Cubamyces sp. BRFM 1775]|nr:hypothetical protein GY45DRAFT_1320660 [Cubamyces sp. BRFM 1775]
MHLTTLPEDVIFQVFLHLDADDILSIRQTCKWLAAATRDRAVWHYALSKYSKRSALPVPSIKQYDLLGLSGAEMERLTRRTLAFWSNWQSPQPKAHQEIWIRPGDHGPNARNLSVIFLPHLPAHVLTLTLLDTSSRSRRFLFELWHVAGLSATCVDRMPIQALTSYAVNTITDSPTIFTITRRDPQTEQSITEAYRINTHGPSTSIHVQLAKQFPGYPKTVGLHGPWLMATDAHKHIRMFDVDEGRLRYTLNAPTTLSNPALVSASQELQCLDTVVWGDFVLSFCKQYIVLYHVPSATARDAATSLDSLGDAPRVDAAASYKWRWRIDTVTAMPRRENHIPSATNVQSLTAPPLIDILVRFDTWFPWPVNLLHHFALVPNPDYRPDTLRLSDPATLPYLFSPADGPITVHSIPSPLRIFTPSDVILGPYGTALWLDASTDTTTPSQAGDHGQRIAGMVLSRIPLPARRVLPGDGPQDDHVSPGLAGLHLEGAERVEREDSSTTAGAVPYWPDVSVFHIQDREERWNRLAVDEEGGRIAIGHTDGTVKVCSYVPSAL